MIVIANVVNIQSLQEDENISKRIDNYLTESVFLNAFSSCSFPNFELVSGQSYVSSPEIRLKFTKL